MQYIEILQLSSSSSVCFFLSFKCDVNAFYFCLFALENISVEKTVSDNYVPGVDISRQIINEFCSESIN